MDRRTILAFVLMVVVIIVAPILFPTHRPVPTTAADSAAMTTPAATAGTGATVTTPAESSAPGAARTSVPTIAAAPQTPIASAPSRVAPTTPRTPADSVVVTTPVARYTLTSAGAVPSSVTLTGYRDLRPGHKDSVVTLAQPQGPLLQYRLALGADTVALDTVPFTMQRNGATTTFTAASPAITISYQTTSDGYLSSVHGAVANAPAGAALIIALPDAFRETEADSLDDFRHRAYGYKLSQHDLNSISFGKLDTGKFQVDTGAMDWVAARSKYWLVALISPTATGASRARPTPVFRDMIMRGGERVLRTTRAASATTIVPLANGAFAFSMYVGPQTWQQLHALDDDIENVNPLGGFLHSVVQPLSTIVMRMLLWMKTTTHVNYGWVVILFGIAIRVVLWPLYTGSMRTSIKMQRLQPELQAVQKKYKDDPEKQRDALMKLYAAHEMSPLSPMLGCLPMLLPMPVLWALYYVFQNTIEFRGVPFLWLPDISLRDPTYIIPILMGLSMFLLSWIGMRAGPQNAQTKMMTFMMPVMMTVIFLNFASGLNLYYAVQNIAALPQQWMVARERAKAGIGTSPAGAVRKT